MLLVCLKVFYKVRKSIITRKWRHSVNWLASRISSLLRMSKEPQEWRTGPHRASFEETVGSVVSQVEAVQVDEAAGAAVVEGRDLVRIEEEDSGTLHIRASYQL